MYSSYPTAPMERMQQVRQRSNRGALDGPSLPLMNDVEFQTQALGMHEVDITRALVRALFEQNGQAFTASVPTFTLTRTSSKYPRLFTVASTRNRGASTSPSLAVEAAKYLTSGVKNGVSTNDPLFLRIFNRSGVEHTALLAGFAEDGADLVPLLLLGGILQRPPLQGSYPRNPFSKMARSR